ncbi:MAG: putative signaling protein [Firmicutes bacterium]|nr:putative signaling protein [Bacillota bacterium]
MLNSEPINLGWLLEHRAIHTYFQPIVSVEKQRIIGLEALSRGLDENNKIIMPQVLFSSPMAKDFNIDLDRLCRAKALENYKKIIDQGNDYFLFLNFDTSILDKGVVGSGNLIDTVTSFGLSPSSIVIEIAESKVHDRTSLLNFIEIHKRLGFLIALDDIGSDSSNLNRILLVRPDIIKIDREIIQNIDTDSYKQELFKALVAIAKKTGTLVVAEGTETLAETVTCLELGANFIQGYYFAKPGPYDKHLIGTISMILPPLISLYHNSKINKLQNEIVNRDLYEITLQKIADLLSYIHPQAFDQKLKEIAFKNTVIQCCYILDMAGKQITDTVNGTPAPKINCHRMFQPDFKGADQSLKDYCLFIKSGFKKYISEPYVSLANGCHCVTASTIFRTFNSSYILCIDFNL